MASYDSVLARLARVGQEHLLRFYETLSPAHKAQLLGQISELDLESLPGLIERYIKSPAASAPPTDIEPVDAYPHDAGDRRKPWDRARYRKLGEDLLRAGKVAAFMVALA